jgi:hypothetical protein
MSGMHKLAEYTLRPAQESMRSDVTSLTKLPALARGLDQSQGYPTCRIYSASYRREHAHCAVTSRVLLKYQ